MATRKSSISIISISFILMSLVLIAVIVSQVDTIQTYFSQAFFKPANLIIDTKGVIGVMPRPWQFIAQGGESPLYRFAPVTGQLKKLEPQYVRLDHVYDFYNVVSRQQNGTLMFDWTLLNEMIADIASAGAKPFISLSYMPPALNPNDLTGAPTSWNEWALVVQKTIEQVSGENGLAISDVYYEVWNEPDLFGQWKTYGNKNYLTLYEYAAKGANAAKSVKPFKFGGPATTKLYDNWVTRFVDYTVKNNLRFDFFSWHHYTTSVDEYVKDYDRYDQLMRRYPDLIFKVEPVISEWGFSSNVHPGYDSNLAAAHTVTTLSTIIPKIEKMFLFEFQDGKDPLGQEYWGKWGILTHQDFGSNEKPRYESLEFLNRLGLDRLSLTGNGYKVRALAGKDKETGSIQVVIANYDPDERHAESVPVMLQRLDPGSYSLTKQFIGLPPTTEAVNVTNSSFSFTINLYPNAVVYLQLDKR